jgi:TrmH family RNA methyltransferase
MSLIIRTTPKRLGIFGTNSSNSWKSRKLHTNLSLISANALKAHLSERYQITSLANDKIKVLKGLISRGKTKGKDALVLVEGHKQVTDALKYGFVPRHILMTDRALRAPSIENLLKSLAVALNLQVSSLSENKNLRIIEMVSEELMKSLTDVETPQGIVAAFSRPDFSANGNAKMETPKDLPLAVLLDRVSDSGNVGTIVRSAHGLGVDVLFSSEGTADPLGPKAMRASAGSSLCMPVIPTSWKSVGEAVALGCHKRALQSLTASNMQISFAAKSPGQASIPVPLQVVIADCDPSGIPYTSIDFLKPTLLVVGNESSGVHAQARTLKRATRCYIPSARQLDSFNVGVAASIILSEVARQRGIIS